MVVVGSFQDVVILVVELAGGGGKEQDVEKQTATSVRIVVVRIDAFRKIRVMKRFLLRVGPATAPACWECRRMKLYCQRWSGGGIRAVRASHDADVSALP